MFLYIFKIIIKLIMTSSRFDLGPTSKPLNLSLLRFNERSRSENLDEMHGFHKFCHISTCLSFFEIFLFERHGFIWSLVFFNIICRPREWETADFGWQWIWTALLATCSRTSIQKQTLLSHDRITVRIYQWQWAFHNYGPPFRTTKAFRI